MCIPAGRGVEDFLAEDIDHLADPDDLLLSLVDAVGLLLAPHRARRELACQGEW